MTTTTDHAPSLGRAPSSPPSPPASASTGAYPARWLALGVLIAAAFMDLLDTTIVNVAVPSIRLGLDATYASIEWVVSGYLLAFAVALITGGRLGDIYGRKRVFIAGVGAFGLTSLLSGVATSSEMLIAARFLQGLAAAAMIPQILAMVQVTFPREEQVKAVSLYTSFAGVATMSGPMLAGILLHADVLGLGWRAIFLINVPVAAIVILGALRWMPESRSERAQRLDLGGVALLSVTLFMLVFALIEGRQKDWPVWSFVMLAAVAPMLWSLIVHQRRREVRGEAPLVPLSLFSQRTFAAGSLAGLVFFSGLVGFFLVFTIFLQLGLGFSPLDSALTTFPSSVGLVVSALVSQRFADRLGRTMLHVGVALMIGAMVTLIWTVGARGAGLGPWDVRPVILFFGFGMGMTLPKLADFVLADVETANAGAASGVLNSGLQVGNVLGIVFAGLILFSTLGTHASVSADGAAGSLDRALQASGVAAETRARTVEEFQQCFVGRAQEEDPSVVPAACRVSAAAAPVGPLVASSLSQARADNFVVAIQHALWFIVAVLGATFVLVFLLPKQPRADDLVVS